MHLTRFACLFLAFTGVMMTFSPASTSADQKPAGKLRFYIGTYNSPKSKGIYRSELDLASGKLSEPILAVEAESPSFVALHPSQKFLYAVNESGGGTVAAFAIDAEGQLKFLNQKSSGGAGPCHLIVDPAGKHVLVANYSGGNATVLPILPDGTLGERTGHAQHPPCSDRERPRRPLAHSINLDPSARFAFVCDAGVDQVFIYKYDAEKGTLTPNTPPSGLTAPDAAPRHFAMHPNGKQCYAINEAELSVTVFDFDSQTGAESRADDLHGSDGH
ncbi:MAG: lactonase family protein [Planctomycetales bacterium]